MVKKCSKKGSISGGGSPKLTKKETEILSIILDDDLTPKQLSCRLGLSHSYCCRMFRNLKKKGALKSVQKSVQLSGLGLEQKRGIRLHGERWRIQIIYKDDKYTKHLKKANTLNIDKNTIKLFDNKILIYSNNSFFGEDAESATIKSLNYWNRFFIKLENHLDIIIVKSRSHNIKRYRQEYALINNGLAKKCHKEGQKIRLRDRQDGRIWFEIDNSFNLHEAETKHPKTADLDMQEIVEPFFNDLKENGPYKISDIVNILGDLAKDRALYAENIKTHVWAIKEMAEKLGKFSEIMEKLDKKL